VVIGGTVPSTADASADEKRRSGGSAPSMAKVGDVPSMIGATEMN
jgi:hypothetical protein